MVTGGIAQARFDLQDANRIDPEERYGTETYNDKISYRHPVSWLRLWRDKDTGYRVSAGSLDATRFTFSENIKIHANGMQPVTFTFKQNRVEDTLEERLDQEVRITWNPFWLVRISMLGAGGTHKQFGDIGGALAIKAARDKTFEAYYWSVDHFYATKKAFPEDYRTTNAQTAGVLLDWAIGNWLWLFARVEVDDPFRWYRVSAGYQYDYERKWSEAAVSIGPRTGLSVNVAAQQEEKKEAKLFFAPAPLTHNKTYERKARIIDLDLTYNANQSLITTGVALISRDGQYSFTADSGVTEEQYVEPPNPTQSLRNEQGYYSTWHFPLSTAHFLQLGLHINKMRIEENDVKSATEVKFQSIWDYHLNDAAHVLLNFTWDLDQLQKDFPYKKTQFKPWGGGAIGFIATL